MPHDSQSKPASPTSSATLALAALGWLLEDDDRAQRYLDLTGLNAETLRSGLGDPAVLVSCLDFLANFEPDLLKASEALAVTPEDLIAARQDLSRKAS